MPFVDLQDANVYYAQVGKGRPLVLIHGAWASHAWWRWQLPELSRRYWTIAVDMRGHGQSTPLEAPYSIQGYARDLEFVLRHLQIDQSVLIGWSLGGMIAIQHALGHPSSVAALVLIATRAHRSRKLRLQYLQLYLQTRLMLLMALSQPRKYDRRAQRFPNPGRNLLNKQIRRMLSPKSSPQVIEWVMADLNQDPGESFFEILKSFWKWETADKLKQISAPTLILVGEHDCWIPPHFSKLLHLNIPTSRLVVVKNAGHCLPIENPEQVNSEILEFLQELYY